MVVVYVIGVLIIDVVFGVVGVSLIWCCALGIVFVSLYLPNLVHIGRVVGFGAGEVVRDAGVSRRVVVVFVLLVALTELLCTLVSVVVVLVFSFPAVVVVVDGCSDG